MLSRPVYITSSPGVYIFKRLGKPLYIGKAKNLKKRLACYWRKNASNKVKSLLTEVNELELFETQSEIEALIKESELVKKHLPKYNVLLRDDKNYFYVAITKEKFPKIFVTHQPNKTKNKHIGPFTSGSALKTTLKLLRRIFPYCTCKTQHKRPCLNAQIGRCFGFCCTISSVIARNNSDEAISRDRHELRSRDDSHNIYQKNIKNITAILTGEKRSLLKNLKGGIKKLSQEQKFEKAAAVRNQVFGIENIFKHSAILEDFKKPGSLVWSKIEKELQTIFNSSHKISRVEGYDISNIQGREATGSVVVFVNGIPSRKDYRHFRIKSIEQANDVGMIKEVLIRRLKHKEWSYPDLILVDGGRSQLNTAVFVIEYKCKLSNTVVIALAKKEEELYIQGITEPIKLSGLPQPISFFLKRVRDESHRFARRYHHKLRRKSVLS